MTNRFVSEELPEPDRRSVLHSQKLVKVIQEECRQSTAGIPFSRFMHLALYAPGLGYYSSGLQKFGEAGDFITAPEVSSMFSQCVARQLRQVLAEVESADVLEFGAGSGAMAADILLELERHGSLPEHYYIVELSAELRERQKQTIIDRAGHLLDKVAWLDTLPQQAFQGVIVANEVLDAMPVECFRVNEGVVEQLRVFAQDGRLLAEYVTADESFARQVRLIEQRRESPFKNGYCSEFNPAVKAWLASLYAMISRGAVLLIDYGYTLREYYLEERRSGTLICHYQHRAHADPLWYPGLQDITAFVDFTTVAHAADEAGFGVCGYTTQALFLMGCGLSELHQSLVDDDPRQQILLAQQIKTLTMPSEMGERFKVMALNKDVDLAMIGFSMQDYRHRL